MYLVSVCYTDGNVSKFITKDFNYVVSAVKITESDDDIISVNIEFISEVKN